MYVQIALFEGFDLLDVVAPYEVLSAGSWMSAGKLRVELAACEGSVEIPSGTGPGLRATATLDPDAADLIVIPGVAGDLGSGENSIQSRLGRTLGSGLPAVLAKAMKRPEVTVATVCGGSLLMAMAGLIPGRHAVTHHLGMEALKESGVEAVHARIVDDGDLVSSGGVTSGLDIGLYLLERELGPRIAHGVESLFAYERRGTVWRAEGLVPASLMAA